MRSVDWNKVINRYLRTAACRSSHEERGLKYPMKGFETGSHCRSSHEERGLKSTQRLIDIWNTKSLLAWGAWIEIYSRQLWRLLLLVAPRMRSVDWNNDIFNQLFFKAVCRSSHEERGLKFVQRRRLLHHGPSLLAWGAWIEIRRTYNQSAIWKSLLAWGAWIEIMMKKHLTKAEIVAPRMRSVDWNK